MRWKQAVAEGTGKAPDHPTEEETIRARLPRSPSGVPWLGPDQVAPVAVFLASDAAAMVTGAAYEVTGGRFLRTTPPDTSGLSWKGRVQATSGAPSPRARRGVGRDLSRTCRPRWPPLMKTRSLSQRLLLDRGRHPLASGRTG